MTFTAHLVHVTTKPNETIISRMGNAAGSKTKQSNFGYGLLYKTISRDMLKKIPHPFITLFTPGYSNYLPDLNRSKRQPGEVIIVIHDPTNIPQKIVPYIKKWKIITIRKSVQHYLQSRFGLESLFLYHPFFPYPTIPSDANAVSAVSISRISYEKNTDVIIKANKILGQRHAIKIYGTPRKLYHVLKRRNSGLESYYYGQFEKSFTKLSEILSKAKFVVDLSTLPEDGGGTQYTFLEAIHNNCALVVHRKWLNGVIEKHRDLEEDYNCFAVDDERELAQLIKANPNTDKLVSNAKKLMKRHIKVDWSFLLYN